VELTTRFIFVPSFFLAIRTRSVENDEEQSTIMANKKQTLFFAFSSLMNLALERTPTIR
jgi:hypothetical protein